MALIATGLVAANLAGAGVHILFERPVLSWLHEFGARRLLTNEGGHAKVKGLNQVSKTRGLR